LKYKLIAIDVDGTLNKDDHTTSIENINAIKKAIENNIKVILCSGRSPASLHYFEEIIGLNIPNSYGIGFNGACVYDAYIKQNIFGEFIEKSVAKKIIKKIKNLDTNIKLAFYSENDILIAEKGLEKILTTYTEGSDINIQFSDEITEDSIKSDILNIYFIQERTYLEPIFETFKNDEILGYTVSFTQENLIEFMPLKINKANGLLKLCNHLNITMNEVVTVGDNYNDIEMVKEAGLGIAVSNAVKELKDIADYVTKRNNNKSAIEEVVDLVIQRNNEYN